MTWSVEIRACKTVWTSLMALDQISEQTLFKDAGAKLMRDLAFFAGDGSDAAMKTRARALALDLDGIFRSVRGGMFEDGVSHVGAIDALAEILKTEDNNIENLADTADEKYHFRKEGQ